MTADQERLDQIAARTEAATRGPWRWGYPGSASPELVGTAGDENYSYETDVLLADHDGGCACRKECTLTVTVSAPDAVFIAAAREDVPWLLSVVRGQAEQIAALQEALRELVALKDGPRDLDYYERKPRAWQAARRLLTPTADVPTEGELT